MSDDEKLKIIIEAQNKAQAAFDQANAQIESTEKKYKSMGDRIDAVSAKMRKAGKALSIGLTLPIVALGVEAGKSLIRIEQIGAQTDAVLKSTGNAANTTREKIDALAGKLENLTGAEAESTTQGQNMLLTFTNIRNGVGKGNDIFNQATKTMLDMGTAMNGGVVPAGEQLKGTAIQLGKALNDPIKGISALSKVGVTFTAQQKEQIAAMVKSGDTMGAQKVIIAELNKEFGGSAEAFGKTTAGKIAILKHRFGTLTETLMSQFMPAILKVVEKVSGAFEAFTKLSSGQKRLITILIGVAAAIGPVLYLFGMLSTVIGFIASPIGIIVIAIGALIAAFVYLWKTNADFKAAVIALWGKLSKFISNAWENYIKPALKALGDFMVNTVAPALLKLWAWWQSVWPGISKFLADAWNNVIKPIFKAIVDVVKLVWKIFQDAWPAIQVILKVAGVVIGAVLVGIYWVIKNILVPVITFLVKAMEVAWNVISTIVKWAWNNVIKPIWDLIYSYIVNILIPIWSKIWDAVQVVWNAISSVIKWAWNNVIKPLWDAIYAYITTVLVPIWNVIWTVVQTVWNAIWGAIQSAWNIMQPIFQAIWDYITNTLVPIFQAIWDKVKEVFTAVWNKIMWVKDKIVDAFNTVKDAIKTVIDKFISIKDKIGDAFSTIGDAIKAPFKTAFNWIADGWNKTLGKLSFTIPDWIPGIGGKKFDMPDMPKLYKGVRDFGGGLATVGDINGRGGEIVNLPSGSDVYNNSESKRIMRAMADGSFASGSNGGGTVNTFTGNINLMNADAVKEFFKQLDRQGELASMGVPA